MFHPPRTIAVGDIHGWPAALDALLAAICPAPDDTLITLGDVIDRGPDSRGAIEWLRDLGRRCRLIPLLGNHEDMLLAILDERPLPEAGDYIQTTAHGDCPGSRGPAPCEARPDAHGTAPFGLRESLLAEWLPFGGEATLRSYGVRRPEDIPAEHIAFLRGCRLWHESSRHFFVHGNYLADVPLCDQPRETLLWESLKTRLPGPHVSGKTAVVGHTAQKSGEILDLGHLKCIDTWCYGDGWLTALDVESGRVWQADKHGRLKS